jgi:hypothetical protein
VPILPAHLGPAVLAGGLAGRKLNFLVLITSTLIIDLEVVVLGIKRGVFIYHGIFHTLGGATVYALIYGSLFFFISQIYWKGKELYYHDVELLPKFKKWRNHNWTYSLKCMIISALVGVYLHIGLDWLIYEDIRIFTFFYPNFYYDFTSQYYDEIFFTIYTFCIIAFFIGVGIYMLRNLEDKKKWYRVRNLLDTDINDGDLWIVLGLFSTPFALAGVVMIFVFIFAFHINGPIFLFSIISIILMILGYSMALENKNWKLFE